LARLVCFGGVEMGELTLFNSWNGGDIHKNNPSPGFWRYFTLRARLGLADRFHGDNRN